MLERVELMHEVCRVEGCRTAVASAHDIREIRYVSMCVLTSNVLRCVCIGMYECITVHTRMVRVPTEAGPALS
jgi:hypothetical protein